MTLWTSSSGRSLQAILQGYKHVRQRCELVSVVLHTCRVRSPWRARWCSPNANAGLQPAIKLRGLYEANGRELSEALQLGILQLHFCLLVSCPHTCSWFQEFDMFIIRIQATDHILICINLSTMDVAKMAVRTRLTWLMLDLLFVAWMLIIIRDFVSDSSKGVPTSGKKSACMQRSFSTDLMYVVKMDMRSC